MSCWWLSLLEDAVVLARTMHTCSGLLDFFGFILSPALCWRCKQVKLCISCLHLKCLSVSRLALEVCGGVIRFSGFDDAQQKLDVRVAGNSCYF